MSFGDTTNAGMSARTDTGGGIPRSVTAFFDTGEAAQTARRDLIQAGVPDASIRVATGTEAAIAAAPAHEHGFWASLMEFFLPDEDRFSYAEGLRRGGCTLAVHTDEARYAQVLDILDRDGAVDMDEREASWREQGWNGYEGRAPAGATSGEAEAPAYEPAAAGTAGFGASRADHFPVADESTPATASPVPQSAPLAGPVHHPAHEDLDDGYRGSATPDTAYAAAAPGLAPSDGFAAVPTRDFSHGRSRVRSYVAGAPGVGSTDRSD